MMSNRDFTVYVRDNLADTGQVPNPYSVVWHSPDIILWHQEFTPEQAQAKFGTTASYGQFEGRNLYPGSNQNFMYVRMKNTQSSDSDVKLHLWELPSDLLNFPGTWHSNNLIQEVSITAKGTASVANGVTVAPVVNLAPTHDGQTGHFCYIAEIIPSGDTPLLPAIGDNYWSWTSSMANNNTLAQCNCYLVQPSLTTVTCDKYSMTNTRTHSTTDYNTQVWLDCSTLPLNCAVSMWTPSLSSGQAGYYDNRENPFIVSNASKVFIALINLPAAPAQGQTWSTPISVQWTYPDGVTAQVGEKVTVKEYYIVDEGALRDAERFGIQHSYKVGEVL
ncbi:MAG: hypothetical protein ACPGUV_00840, partial [Polyangiales bacterium]